MNKLWIGLAAILILSLLFFFRGNITQLFVTITSCETAIADPYLQALYDQAVADAKVIEEDEYANELTTISGEVLTDGKVKVVAWMDEYGMNFYKNAKTDTIPYPYDLPVDLWVTITPNLRNFCNQRRFKDSSELELRLEQVLGLHYSKQYEYMVELWVDTTYLKRATPNPSIKNYQRSATVDQPEGDLAFNAWFTENLASSFGGNVEYPWTRLGYTYDWGNPDSDIGMSEFIILGDRYGPVEVWIDSIYTTGQYCVPSK